MKYLIVFFCLSSSLVNSQNTDISGAIEFLNLYQNDENWIFKKVGGFVYNKYGKTLSYKSTTEFFDGKNTVMDIEYIISLENVISIEENIHKSDPSKVADPNIIFFDLILKNDVFYKFHDKQDGQTIPQYTNKPVKLITIEIEKQLTSQDLLNLQKAIRDIFINKPIKTNYL